MRPLATATGMYLEWHSLRKFGQSSDSIRTTASGLMVLQRAPDCETPIEREITESEASPIRDLATA